MSMNSPSIGVKGPRRYDGSSRRERSHERRQATFDGAEQLFLRDGYAATTVGAIARGAGISPATIYKTYGGKKGVLRALCHRALQGSGPVPAQERSDALHAGGSTSFVLEGWRRLVVEVAPRILPLLIVLNEAATVDTDARELRHELSQERLARMEQNARALADAGHLGPDVVLGEARDVLWLATSPEIYDLLVCRRGWTVERYSAHVTQMLRSVLLSEEPDPSVT